PDKPLVIHTGQHWTDTSQTKTPPVALTTIATDIRDVDEAVMATYGSFTNIPPDIAPEQMRQMASIMSQNSQRGPIFNRTAIRGVRGPVNSSTFSFDFADSTGN